LTIRPDRGASDWGVQIVGLGEIKMAVNFNEVLYLWDHRQRKFPREQKKEEGVSV
jgi:hypothetical protein